MDETHTHVICTPHRRVELEVARVLRVWGFLSGRVGASQCDRIAIVRTLVLPVVTVTVFAFCRARVLPLTQLSQNKLH